MRDTLLKLRILRGLLAATWRDWRQSVWDRDLDERYCCDGRECGCMGSSVREVWEWECNR